MAATAMLLPERRDFSQDNPSVNGPVGQSSPVGKYCRHVVYCLHSNKVQDILFANNNVTPGEIYSSVIFLIYGKSVYVLLQ